MVTGQPDLHFYVLCIETEKQLGELHDVREERGGRKRMDERTEVV